LCAQPLPATYVVRLASATNYAPRARGADVIHAALTLFVNGRRTGSAIWDGRGWDGSRIEGRTWESGLHIFGPAGASTVELVARQVADSDTVQIVFQLFSGADAPLPANFDAAADRIRQSSCAGGDAESAWNCLAPQSATLTNGWPLAGCAGFVAADLFVYTGMQLRRKTEAGETATIGHTYQATAAAPGCGQSIYGASVAIARQ
jgi:hypothetical protein